MHTLDAAMAEALLNRRERPPQPSPGELSREETRIVARLALVLAIVAGFAVAMEGASRTMPEDDGRRAAVAQRR